MHLPMTSAILAGGRAPRGLAALVLGTHGILALLGPLGAPAGAQEAAVAAPPETAPAQAPALEVTYLANEGFLVERGGVRVLVDGLFASGAPGYPVLPGETLAELERGGGRFAGVSVALATHYHRDHFDPGVVARFLAANPGAVFVSTPQAVERLEREPGATGFRERVRAVLPAAGEVEVLEVGGARITVLNLHHGPRQPPVENIGLVVELGGRRFLHFGDTEAKREEFEPYLDLLRGVDVALLPFWFLSSEWRAGMVRMEIAPREIVVAHLPEPDAPPGHFGRWGSWERLVELIRGGFPGAHIPGRSGERFGFAFEGVPAE